MARLVTKFKYLKPDQEKPIGGYATYIATREGVEKIDESFKLAPATAVSYTHLDVYKRQAQDCSRKFHNCIGSSFAVRRLSDRVCIEHELSVIQNPKQHRKGRFLHYGQWIGEKRCV